MPDRIVPRETPTGPRKTPTGAGASGPIGAPAGESRGRRDPTDEELDQYIRTRLALIGIDIDVLPEEDSSAPADQMRILRSARGVLRNTVPALSRYPLDPQEVPPSLYPAHLPGVGVRTADEGRDA